jgi:acyl transferase domain-containing protein/thioesterase domain-containing protein
MSDLKISDSIDGIAVIGLAGRFPKSRNIEEFWHNLRDGVEMISFFTDEELVALGVNPALLDEPTFVKAKAYLEGIDLFDARFFGYSPREAEIMDPQQRFFLECAWEALENAGYDSEKYEGSIGVFAGVTMNSYLLNNLYTNSEVVASAGGFQTVMGNDKDHLPTRVSYKLNLKGPSVNVQTTCSTSLVAVHLACQSLLNYQCDMTLAGGVSITVPQKMGYSYQAEGIVSPDGHCRTFDAKASGTVAGNGVGIVVLKRLADALNDGDTIYAVIKGSAVNNDGSDKVGYTAPSVSGQAAVILEAQAIAGVDPETISYVEAHGTATPIGDPIEVEALQQAFRTQTDKHGYCAIGSVKTNVGHLDAAAGVTGLIKTILSLRHKQLPPSLHYEEPNPKIDFAASPFFVNDRLREWESNGGPRRAGVSSFGIGGTNAHVIVEEAPEVEEGSESQRQWQVLVSSAKTESGLAEARRRLAEELRRKREEVELADVAWTLQVGRRGFGYRSAVVCRSVEEAIAALESGDAGRAVVTSVAAVPGERPVVFMFPGQGVQQLNMGLELYETEESFRVEVDRCAEILKPHLGLDLRTVLYPGPGQEETAREQIQRTELTQPALFVVEYALAKLLNSWGVQPDAMIGHSIGEYVAACLAGVMSLEDALSIVAVRGRLMQQQPAGAMLAVGLKESDVQIRLGAKLTIAAINSPNACVVSGPLEAVEALQQSLSEEGVWSQRLATSHAFHSQMMEPIVETFTRELRQIKLHAPKIPYISNVTGNWITAAEATDAAYWGRQLRQTVRFGDGLTELLKGGEKILLEVGPGQTLSGLARQLDVVRTSASQLVIPTLGRGNEQTSSVEALLTAVARLWIAGTKIDWPRLHEGERRRRIPLPTYPFEPTRCWVEPKRSKLSAGISESAQGRRSDIADWFYAPFWKQSWLGVETGAQNGNKERLRWLVFRGKSGIGAELAKSLAQDGHDVVSVIAGKKFRRLNEHDFEINPQARDNYRALFKDLGATNRLPEKLLHLWGVAPPQQSHSSDIKSLEQSQYRGLYSLLFLAQALGKQDLNRELRIGIVTNSMLGLTGEELIQPEKATVLGLAQVISQEYPNITCQNIDIVRPKAKSIEERKLILQLIAELSDKSSDKIVAYRGQHRWVRNFEAVRLERPTEKALRLKDGGVYLITGAAEDAALEIAEYIAGTVKANLVITTHASVPPRDIWECSIAQNGEDHPLSRKLRRVQSLEENGADVLLLSTDVTDEQKLRTTLNQTLERFKAIHGVIYTAADLEQTGGNALRDVSLNECRKHLQQASGLLLLEKVLQNRELDFCLLLSSLSSALGLVGTGVRSAVSYFMDALTQAHNRQNSLQWTRASWDETQTASLQAQDEAANSSQAFIKPTEAIEVLKRILQSNALTQLLVSPVDLQARIAEAAEVKTSQSKEAAEGGEALSGGRPNLRTPYVAPRNADEQLIADLWSDLLGVDQVGVNDDFFELGGHSLAGIQLIFRLRAAFNLEDLHLNSLFEKPTVAGLAESVAQARRAELSWPNILVPLQPKGTKPPFFCMHPIGGDAFGMVHLARHMAPDYPFYAIHSMGLAEVGQFGDYASLEEMASEYIDVIRFVSPEGPFLLGGLSYGGIVAFEMAQQLTKRGYEVPLLVMLDTPAPETIAKVARLDDAILLLGLVRERARQNGIELGVTASDFDGLNPDEKLDYLLNQLKAVNLAPTDLGHDWLLNFIKGFRTRINNTVKYVPKVFPGRITLFRASERDTEMKNHLDRVEMDFTNQTLGWDKVSAEPVALHLVPGYHEIIATKDNSEMLAAKLKECIDKSIQEFAFKIQTV